MDKSYVLITGGAGFVGTNLADRLLEMGQNVLILDNLARAGASQNWRWLSQIHGERVRLQTGDVRDRQAVRQAVQSARQVYHLAAQVALSSSLTDVGFDFTANAQGTVVLLEELKRLKNPPPMIFPSTTKVYGALDDVQLRTDGIRYEPVSVPVRMRGISENRPLDFYSPYGCSKGSADQYVLEFARSFGLRNIVFRLSCVYGPHQFGTEDEGWVAHFLTSAMADQPIVLYGDGCQIRDILYVDDLVDAFLLAQAHIEELAGQAFNIGGGPGSAISLLEMLDVIEELMDKKPDVTFDHWRPGDQRYYVTDSGKFRAATGWSPKIGIRQGVEKLYQWLMRARKPLASKRVSHATESLQTVS